jgi:hypothetical protein
VNPTSRATHYRVAPAHMMTSPSIPRTYARRWSLVCLKSGGRLNAVSPSFPSFSSFFSVLQRLLFPSLSASSCNADTAALLFPSPLAQTLRSTEYDPVLSTSTSSSTLSSPSTPSPPSASPQTAKKIEEESAKKIEGDKGASAGVRRRSRPKRVGIGATILPGLVSLRASESSGLG